MALLVTGAGMLEYAVVRLPAAPSAPPPPAYEPPYPLFYERLGNGSIPLQIPFMTLYTPVSVPGNVTFTAYAEFGSTKTLAANATYTWGQVEGAALPVHFMLAKVPQAAEPGPIDGFRLALGGGCANCGSYSLSLDISTPKTGAVLLFEGVLQYTAWKVTPAAPLDRYPFLLIESTLVQESRTGMLFPTPVLNLSLPGPGDLVLVSASVNASVGSTTYNDRLSVHRIGLPLSVFHLALPPVTFDAGAYGRVTARLLSNFTWNAACDYVLSLDSPQDERPVPVSFRLYVDTRFGSLYPVVLS